MHSSKLSRFGGRISSQKCSIPFGTRGMGESNQDLRRRMKSIAGIQKITKAMKMVSSSKLRAVQRLLDVSRVFRAGTNDLFNLPQKDGKAVAPEVQKDLILMYTGDRGLCGSVNSIISKFGRRLMTEALEAKRTPLLYFIGEKAKSPLVRECSEHFHTALCEVGKKKPATFDNIMLITEDLLKVDFDRATFLFNYFRSAISFKPVSHEIYSYNSLSKLGVTGFEAHYEIDDNKFELARDLYEFHVAAVLYNIAIEAGTSEHASRMQATEGSSKNARELIARLQLAYNKNRQAGITRELLEITTGMVSMGI